MSESIETYKYFSDRSLEKNFLVYWLIKLGAQVLTDEIEAAEKTKTTPFDWNIMGWDKSRPPQTRSNGESIHNPEHIARKLKNLY